MWSDRIDDILAGDLAVALAYVTPRAGVVLTPVAPMGMRDRARGTVAFSTSLAFWRKLTRIERDPSVALCYHTRDHGLSQRSGYLVVQGAASFPRVPPAEWLSEFPDIAAPYLGPLKSGWPWDRLVREYYWVRVPVTIDVERIVDHEGFEAPAPTTVVGAPVFGGLLRSQDLPARGIEPRIPPRRVARKAARLGNTLLGFVGGDGYPEVVPVDVTGATDRGVVLSARGRTLPSGGRRAGLLSHQFGPHLTKQENRVHTGWLTVDGAEALYAPHTAAGPPRAPGGVRTLTFIASMASKAGIRTARKQGVVEGDVWMGKQQADPPRRASSQRPAQPTAATEA